MELHKTALPIGAAFHGVEHSFKQLSSGYNYLFSFILIYISVATLTACCGGAPRLQLCFMLSPIMPLGEKDVILKTSRQRFKFFARASLTCSSKKTLQNCDLKYNRLKVQFLPKKSQIVFDAVWQTSSIWQDLHSPSTNDICRVEGKRGCYSRWMKNLLVCQPTVLFYPRSELNHLYSS